LIMYKFIQRLEDNLDMANLLLSTIVRGSERRKGPPLLEAYDVEPERFLTRASCLYTPFCFYACSSLLFFVSHLTGCFLNFVQLFELFCRLVPSVHVVTSLFLGRQVAGLSDLISNLE